MPASVLHFIRALAEYEKLLHEVTATEVGSPPPARRAAAAGRGADRRMGGRAGRLRALVLHLLHLQRPGRRSMSRMSSSSRRSAGRGIGRAIFAASRAPRALARGLRPDGMVGARLERAFHRLLPLHRRQAPRGLDPATPAAAPRSPRWRPGRADMAEQAFDLIVLGGGPGGYVAAIRAASSA